MHTTLGSLCAQSKWLLNAENWMWHPIAMSENHRALDDDGKNISTQC